MISAETIRELKSIVGPSHLALSPVDRELYSYDASLARGNPWAVIFPGNTAEVAGVVLAAGKAGIPFVPRGFGTNLSGGTVLLGGGLVICLSRLNRIISIHPERRSAVVQPGVTNLELQQALDPLGFFFAPDPASQKVATLGGNVGENSGGPHCLKYGVTTNHVLGMEAVLVNGEIIRFGGEAFDPPGYDLRGIMIGSEGTFAVTTEITVRILPKPEQVITLLIAYDKLSDAARTVSDIVSAGIIPGTLEMMDAPVIKAVEDSYACGYPKNAAAVLIIDVEGPFAGLSNQAEEIRKICRNNHCRNIYEAGNEEERRRLWEGRRGAFGAIARLAPSYLVNDCTVPRTRLPEALERVAEIAKRYQFRHGNVFHAGDGNLHPLLFFDSRSPHHLNQVHRAGREIMNACVGLGGTITGEHGIGIEKLEAMNLIFSEEELDFQRTIKRVFDPNHLLNPGKVIPKAQKKNHTENPVEPRLFSRTTVNEKHNRAVQDLIRKIVSLHSAKSSLRPIGNATHNDYGNQLNQDTIALSSYDMTSIIEYDPHNQTVLAGAGVSLGRLQDLLEEHNQWLPIRPPLSLLNHTLGGLVALGACGPERLSYGAPRDLLLGLRFIDGKGRLISTGGRVIKNVAGYDLTRLMAGSAGTLGFITDITFRIEAKPDRCAMLKASGSMEACSETASSILKSQLSPQWVVSMPENPGIDKIMGSRWLLMIGHEGFQETVGDLINKTSSLLDRNNLKVQEIRDYSLLEGHFKDVYEELEKSPFLLRADIPLNRLLRFVQALKDPLRSGKTLLDLGLGRLLIGFDLIEDKFWTRITEKARALGGYVLLEKATQSFKESHEVFGAPQASWIIMHRIKKALDPNNIFSPGCLPGRG